MSGEEATSSSPVDNRAGVNNFRVIFLLTPISFLFLFFLPFFFFPRIDDEFVNTVELRKLMVVPGKRLRADIWSCRIDEKAS